MPMLKRINLCVADLDLSLKVYRDILGFSVNEMRDSRPTSYAHAVFKLPKAAKIRFAVLDAPLQERTLALTEVKGFPLPTPPVPRTAVLVLSCDNFDDVLAKVRAHGLEIIPERIMKDHEGKAKGREAGFADPDGHIIVIYKLN